ncbi:FH protein interacting protein FIP2, partial [Tanacetum coccineum]
TADLTNANLEGANLEGANLKGAKLTNANLKGANLQRAYLRHVNLRETVSIINILHFSPFIPCNCKKRIWKAQSWTARICLEQLDDYELITLWFYASPDSNLLPNFTKVQVASLVAGSTSAMGIETSIALVLPAREHECDGNFNLGRPPALSYAVDILIRLWGKKFCTTMDTLTQREPHSMLAAMFSGRHTVCKDSEKGYVFLDRDGKHFRHILNWLRDGVVPNLTDSECSELLREAEYYQLLVSHSFLL